MSSDNIYLEKCLCLTRNVVRSLKTLSFHRVLSIFLTLDAMEFDLSSYWRLRSFNWCNAHLVSIARDILALSSVLKFVRLLDDNHIVAQIFVFKDEAFVCKVWRLLEISNISRFGMWSLNSLAIVVERTAFVFFSPLQRGILLRFCYIFYRITGSRFHLFELKNTSGAVHERANDGDVSFRVSGSGDVWRPSSLHWVSTSVAAPRWWMVLRALDQSVSFCTMTCCTKMGSPTLVLGTAFWLIVGRTNDPSSNSIKYSSQGVSGTMKSGWWFGHDLFRPGLVGPIQLRPGLFRPDPIRPGQRRPGLVWCVVCVCVCVCVFGVACVRLHI